jgi:hypothetical protein
MPAVPRPQALSSEIGGIPKFVRIIFVWRNLVIEAASIADNAFCSHFDEDFAVSSRCANGCHLRDRLGGAFWSFNAVFGNAHANFYYTVGSPFSETQKPSPA